MESDDFEEDAEETKDEWLFKRLQAMVDFPEEARPCALERKFEKLRRAAAEFVERMDDKEQCLQENRCSPESKLCAFYILKFVDRAVIFRISAVVTRSQPSSKAE